MIGELKQHSLMPMLKAKAKSRQSQITANSDSDPWRGKFSRQGLTNIKGELMTINYNPNLPPNDSLTPKEIQAKVDERNLETQDFAKKAYSIGRVPPKTAEKAAKHMSITRQTAEAKKDIRDANTWWKAKLWERDEDE